MLNNKKTLTRVMAFLLVLLALLGRIESKEYTVDQRLSFSYVSTQWVLNSRWCLKTDN